MRTTEALNVLLARPLLALTHEYERGATGLPSLPMLMFALRIVDDDAIDVGDTPALAARRGGR